MTENELDRQLQMSRQFVVDPPLVLEDELPKVPTSRRTLLISSVTVLLVSCGILGVILTKQPTQDSMRETAKIASQSHRIANRSTPTTLPLDTVETTPPKPGPQGSMGEWHMIRSRGIPSIALRPLTGNTGTSGIELKQEELERIGIYFDSVTTVSSWFGGFTLDTMQTTLKNWVKGMQDGDGHIQHLRGQGADTLGEREVPALDAEACRPAGCLVVLQSTTSDTIDNSVFISADGGMMNSYSRAGKFAAGALLTLSRSKMPIDDILNYTTDDGRIQIPLKALFIPLRYQTPWVHIAGRGNELFRLDVVYIFLARQDCLALLPEQIRTFIGKEYEITLKAIEDQLTQQELCERLEEPSVLGVCPMEETQAAILSVGPIPARDHIRLQLRCNGSNTVDIHLINAQGQLAYTHQPTHLPAGVSEITIPLSGLALPRGAYTMLVTSGDKTATRRILID